MSYHVRAGAGRARRRACERRAAAAGWQVPAEPTMPRLNSQVLASDFKAELLLKLRKSSPRVELRLPRFRAEWGVTSLVLYLRALGVAAAFDGSRVFSRMSDDPDVRIEDVQHKAIIEVNEEGTVAAAATAARFTPASTMPPRPMHFDRPFVMLVVHRPSAVPQFAGRFNHPTFV